LAPAYCQAVLNHQQRIALDGSLAEIVDAKAKDLATKHLARRFANATAKKAMKSVAMVKSKTASAPSLSAPHETPEQLRELVRASLLRRRA
jgi:sRNA-binding protein